jgi:hypothetical protein
MQAFQSVFNVRNLIKKFSELSAMLMCFTKLKQVTNILSQNVILFM